MRKIVLSIFILGSLASLATTAFGHGAFTLSITGGSPTNIGSVYLGQTNFDATPVKLQCETQNNPWELQIYAVADLEDSATGYAMDIGQLKWFGAYAQTNPGGVDRSYGFIKGTGGESIPLSLVNDSVYADAGDQDIEVQVGLGIVVPETQPQGNYKTVVRFIMTE